MENEGSQEEIRDSWSNVPPPWERGLCEQRYIYGERISLKELGEVSGRSPATLAKWSMDFNWTQKREFRTTLVSEKVLEKISEERVYREQRAIAFPEPRPEDLKLAEERAQTIAEQQLAHMEALVEIQLEHGKALRKQRTIADTFHTYFMHILTKIYEGKEPDQGVQRAFNEMIKRAGKSPLQTYSAMLTQAIAGERELYGIEYHCDERKLEAIAAQRGLLLVDAKALEEAQAQPEAG